METISIKKDAALKAHDQATPKQKSLLENLLGKNVFVKNIRERIQTIDKFSNAFVKMNQIDNHSLLMN